MFLDWDDCFCFPQALNVHREINCLTDYLEDSESQLQHVKKPAKKGLLYGVPISIKDSIACKVELVLATAWCSGHLCDEPVGLHSLTSWDQSVLCQPSGWLASSKILFMRYKSHTMPIFIYFKDASGELPLGWHQSLFLFQVSVLWVWGIKPNTASKNCWTSCFQFCGEIFSIALTTTWCSQSLLGNASVSFMLFSFQGHDSTLGLVKRLNQPAAEDAVIVQVLKRQGAVPFVKTNVPQSLLK